MVQSGNSKVNFWLKLAQVPWKSQVSFSLVSKKNSNTLQNAIFSSSNLFNYTNYIFFQQMTLQIRTFIKKNR